MAGVAYLRESIAGVPIGDIHALVEHDGKLVYPAVGVFIGCCSARDSRYRSYRVTHRDRCGYSVGVRCDGVITHQTGVRIPYKAGFVGAYFGGQRDHHDLIVINITGRDAGTRGVCAEGGESAEGEFRPGQACVVNRLAEGHFHSGRGYGSRTYDGRAGAVGYLNRRGLSAHIRPVRGDAAGGKRHGSGFDGVDRCGKGEGYHVVIWCAGDDRHRIAVGRASCELVEDEITRHQRRVVDALTEGYLHRSRTDGASVDDCRTRPIEGSDVSGGGCFVSGIIGNSAARCRDGRTGRRVVSGFYEHDIYGLIIGHASRIDTVYAISIYGEICDRKGVVIHRLRKGYLEEIDPTVA